MAELNLSSVSAAPSRPTAPPQGRAAERDESGAGSFDTVMARATAKGEDKGRPAAQPKQQGQPAGAAARDGDAPPADRPDSATDSDPSAAVDDADAGEKADPLAPDPAQAGQAPARASELPTLTAAPAPDAAIAPGVGSLPAAASVLVPAGVSEPPADADQAPAGNATGPDTTSRPAARGHTPSRGTAAIEGNDRRDPRTHSVGDAVSTSAATADAPPFAPRDRLSEDFQQRFERALNAAASAPRGDAGLAHASTAPNWAGLSPPAPLPGGTHAVTVPTPVDAAAFGEDFSARIALLARGRVHSAELSLTPADLGPVSVSIELRGTDATLVFGAAHAATRAAIEDALPRLREMLDAQGLQLADARVGTQTGNGASRDDDRGAPPSPRTASQPIEPAAAPGAAPHVAARPLRLIDVIA